MTEAASPSSWTDWNPKDYLEEYYTDKVVADEVEALRFQIEALRGIQGKPTVLEFGCGPTVHRAIAAAPYVSEIHMADYLEVNLKEVQNWVDGRKESHDWTHYVRFILMTEGIDAPTQQQITQRIDLAKRKITKLSQADAGRKFPLGQQYEGHYAHVFSYFCADSATADKETWAQFMRNIVSHLAPGGSFMTAVLRNCQLYRSKGHYFPSANVNEDDLRGVLELDFHPETIKIEVRHLPELADEGYEGIVMAHALKRI